MKNISRRVFIKGMAVAAVATAASTVLTGCKLPAGTNEDGNIVVDSSIKSITMTPVSSEKDETLVVTAKGLAIDPITGYAVVDIEYANTTANRLDFSSDATFSATNKYGYTAYVDGDASKVADNKNDVPGNAADLNLYQKNIPSVAGMTTGPFAGKLYFDVTKYEKWEKLYISFKVRGTGSDTVTGILILGK